MPLSFTQVGRTVRAPAVLPLSEAGFQGFLLQHAAGAAGVQLQHLSGTHGQHVHAVKHHAPRRNSFLLVALEKRCTQLHQTPILPLFLVWPPQVALLFLRVLPHWTHGNVALLRLSMRSSCPAGSGVRAGAGTGLFHDSSLTGRRFWRGQSRGSVWIRDAGGELRWSSAGIGGPSVPLRSSFQTSFPRRMKDWIV